MHTSNTSEIKSVIFNVLYNFRGCELYNTETFIKHPFLSMLFGVWKRQQKAKIKYSKYGKCDCIFICYKSSKRDWFQGL